MAVPVSLFQKYRSQSFADLVGQEVVVQTLSNAITSGVTAQVYLFCGPRGTGKTSTARILAKSLNCEKGPTVTPCGECVSCRSITDGSDMDLIELDAASNTQVDKIREVIIDKVMYAPAHSRYKIFIIDEVHMLSASSFNALLKTLEEPPAHVIFVLATTDPHKIPPTILSRCQRHDFQRLTLAQISSRVKYVSEKEGMQCSDAAADLIARSADGSMRDALSELGAVAVFSGGNISAEVVEEHLGLLGYDSIRKFVDSLIDGNAPDALSKLDGFVKAGRDLKRMPGELCEHLRRLLLIQAGAADKDLFDVPDDLFQAMQQQAKRFTMSKLMAWLSAVLSLQGSLGQNSNARILWEMLIIRLAIPGSEDTLQGLARRIERLEAVIAGTASLPEPSAPAPANARSLPAPPPAAVRTSSGSKPVADGRIASGGASGADSAPMPTAPSGIRSAQQTASAPRPAPTKPMPENRASNASDLPKPEADSVPAPSPQPEGSGAGNSNAGSAHLTRPAPKSVPAAKPKAAARAIVAQEAKRVDSSAVRASWEAPAPKAKPAAAAAPAVRPATSAELANLEVLWRSFLKHTNDPVLKRMQSALAEAQRFAYDGSVLTVYVPAQHSSLLKPLKQREQEINLAISEYRSNITKLAFVAEEESALAAAGAKQEHDAFVKQIITTFGAEIVP
ncbi:DNA polymerase III subunit gamma/tau [bacterium]|nr:DNA polymerase III subunit gamma/tau [bacterium]